MAGSVLLKSSAVKDSFRREVLRRYPQAVFRTPSLPQAAGVALLLVDRLQKGLAPEVSAR